MHKPRVRQIATGGRMVRQISFDGGLTWTEVLDTTEPVKCADEVHEWLKSNLLLFEAGTERPPHVDEEVYLVMTDCRRKWLRNCKSCKTSLAIALND